MWLPVGVALSIAAAEAEAGREEVTTPTSDEAEALLGAFLHQLPPTCKSRTLEASFSSSS